MNICEKFIYSQIMKCYVTSMAMAMTLAAASVFAVSANAENVGNVGNYVAGERVRESQRQFSSERFGIFIHWGIYSMFGQGEWYLNYGPNRDEYAKAARGFYPADFDAAKWAKAFKDAGAGYVTFTTRHHDGFSMFGTKQSGYNIVDATPFKRDVLKELSEALQKEGLSLHLYYSHIDWTRDDYPWGRTGRTTGKDSLKADWPHYYEFMNAQLGELLTNYGPIRAIWFDGWWDHDSDSIPFNWELDKQYALIHRLQPGCMVANNHHQDVNAGEDIQIFERDLPGENTAGMSEQGVSRLPLETCNTMNGMWGYKILDQNYKDSKTLIRYLVRAAGMGANLLLNIGPQPNGELPEAALARLKDMGEWLRANGETIYCTEAGPFKPQSWGVATRKGEKLLYAHIMSADDKEVMLPGEYKVKRAVRYGSDEKVKFRVDKYGLTLCFGEVPTETDRIVEIELK